MIKELFFALMIISLKHISPLNLHHQRSLLLDELLENCCVICIFKKEANCDRTFHCHIVILMNDLNTKPVYSHVSAISG